MSTQCDCETGKPGKWTQCKAKATVTIQSKRITGHLFMNYCAKHAPKKESGT